MKKTTLLVFAFICTLACKSQTHQESIWTIEYESKLYKEIDDATKSRIPDVNKRKELVLYTIKRLKQELPNGLESVSKDNLQAVSARIGTDYGYAHKYYVTGIKPFFVKWTPKVEQALREDVLRGKPKDGNKLCDCLIIKFKKVYQDSVVVPFQHDLIIKFAKECRSGMR